MEHFLNPINPPTFWKQWGASWTSFKHCSIHSVSLISSSLVSKCLLIQTRLPSLQWPLLTFLAAVIVSSFVGTSYFSVFIPGLFSHFLPLHLPPLQMKVMTDEIPQKCLEAYRSKEISHWFVLMPVYSFPRDENKKKRLSQCEQGDFWC